MSPDFVLIIFSCFIIHACGKERLDDKTHPVIVVQTQFSQKKNISMIPNIRRSSTFVDRRIALSKFEEGKELFPWAEVDEVIFDFALEIIGGVNYSVPIEKVKIGKKDPILWMVLPADAPFFVRLGRITYMAPFKRLTYQTDDVHFHYYGYLRHKNSDHDVCKIPLNTTKQLNEKHTKYVVMTFYKSHLSTQTYAPILEDEGGAITMRALNDLVDFRYFLVGIITNTTWNPMDVNEFAVTSMSYVYQEIQKEIFLVKKEEFENEWEDRLHQIFVRHYRLILMLPVFLIGYYLTFRARP